jgi:dipeptidyl-peptidase-3
MLTCKLRASLAGNRIVLRQVSPESEHIYDFILALHKSADGDWKALAEKVGVDEQGLSAFLQYAAQFLGNSGNYKSFGDSKFLPRCDESVFASLASTSPEAEKHYKATNGAIFSADKPGLLHLGFTDDGHLTTYYPDSPDITKDEIVAISKWMEDKKLLPENTRLRKTKHGAFELLIASATTSIPSKGGDIGTETEYQIDEGPLKGKTIKLVYGDYTKEMSAITSFIKMAAANAENETQRKMHLAYAESFDTGSLLAFKDSQRHWIRDQGPMVECNIGFIETYRDPAGVRGEWEGFAAGKCTPYSRSVPKKVARSQASQLLTVSISSEYR